MSHQDQGGRVRFNAACLRLTLRWLLGDVLVGVQFRKDCTWSSVQLAAAALLWAWSDELTLVERFHTARTIAAVIFAPQRKFGLSYQCFLKLLVRWTDVLLTRLVAALRQRMQTTLEPLWQVHGFTVLGVDGSRIQLPRTASHEAAYAPADRPRRKPRRNRRKTPRDAAHAKQALGPAMWLTVVWHAGTGLPWAWRIGPTDSSEREHWREMIPELPENALVAADAGYVGYEYTRTLLDSGRHLLLRVGSHVRLLKKLGWTEESVGIVYLWPQSVQGQEQPIALRLVVGHDGKQPIYLVTSVLDPRRLSDQQVLDLYRRRWGIELFFRHLKQTYERRKLRSASAANARVELEWSLAGLWSMALYAEVEIQKSGGPPLRLSFAGMLRSYRRLLRDYSQPSRRGQTLSASLRCALRDNYVRRSKQSRDYPKNKSQKPPPGAPLIRKATRAEVLQAKRLRAKIRKGVTA